MQCLFSVFDPNTEYFGSTIDIDISDPQYVQIHNEYKNLVDYMLGSFMEEMSITPEEFEIACMEGKNLSLLTKEEGDVESHSFSFHKGLFQQIWAANDIRTFVRLMKQRNLEIQIQGTLTFFLSPSCNVEDEKISHLSFVIALDLIERRQASTMENELNSGDENKARKTENVIEKAVEEEIEKSVEAESQFISDAQDTQHQEDDKFKRLNLFFEQEKEARTDGDVATRQEYLRQQRDKILQIKKQARARQLYEETKDRPKSAVAAAQKIIDGETFEPDEASIQVIQVRKLLAKKLRDEVVNKAVMTTNEEH